LNRDGDVKMGDAIDLAPAVRIFGEETIAGWRQCRYEAEKYAEALVREVAEFDPEDIVMEPEMLDKIEMAAVMVLVAIEVERRMPWTPSEKEVYVHDEFRAEFDRVFARVAAGRAAEMLGVVTGPARSVRAKITDLITYDHASWALCKLDTELNFPRGAPWGSCIEWKAMIERWCIGILAAVAVARRRAAEARPAANA
jgi:hypothetical protein